MVKANQKFKVSKWIFLSLSILLNSFLILYSALPASVTAKWNNFVTNIFAKTVNTITEKEAEVIPITSLTTQMSSDKYNSIPCYELTEIPLGSAKEIVSNFAPETATDTSISYYAENSDLVSIVQSGAKASIIGMKTGTTKIFAKNSLSGLISSVHVSVVETRAPEAFSVSLSSNSIPVGNHQTLIFDIDGGVLGHNSLINSRYFDTRKLDFLSSNESVATVNDYGVIVGKEEGHATITIKSGDESKSIDINVIPGPPQPFYTDLKISGDTVCFDKDLIKDQSSPHRHKLQIFESSLELNSADFIWESSNELLVRVDQNGFIRGFRKTKIEDEVATITATSKLTGQTASIEVVVKEELPSSMYYWVVYGEKDSWNPTEYTAFVGDEVIVNFDYDVNISKKGVNAIVSNEDIIECTNQGTNLSLRIKKDGNCTLSCKCIVNPSLEFSIKFTILKAGAISKDDISNVGYSLRKSIGHAALFAVAETFTIISLYMFLSQKRWWILCAISLGFELTISVISEVIQHFVPERFGTFKDMLINFIGALVAAAIITLIFFLVKRKKYKEQNKNDVSVNKTHVDF